MSKFDPLTRETFIGPWAGLPVPWNDRDRFDEPTYRLDVTRCAENRVPGVYTGGTSGEFYAIDDDEFVEITRATVEQAHDHGMPAMIGCTATSTRGATRRVERAVHLSADAVQVALPYWLPLADHEIVSFFVEVARAASPLAVSIYETARAKRTLTVEQHREIHAKVDNYLMVKANDGTVGSTPEGCRALSEFVNVFTGEHQWPELADSGVIGACSSTIYANPSAVLDAFRSLRKGDAAQLRADVERFWRLYEYAFATFHDRGFQDSAWDRLIGNATGFLATGTTCRLPYSSPTEADVASVRAWLNANAPDLLWHHSSQSYQASDPRGDS